MLHLSQYLVILEDNVETLSEALTKLESTNIYNMLNRLSTLYTKDEIFELNLRESYDIITLGYYYAENMVVIAYKVPMAPAGYMIFTNFQ